MQSLSCSNNSPEIRGHCDPNAVSFIDELDNPDWQVPRSNPLISFDDLSVSNPASREVGSGTLLAPVYLHADHVQSWTDSA
jgi:hypothetical protein